MILILKICLFELSLFRVFPSETKHGVLETQVLQVGHGPTSHSIFQQPRCSGAVCDLFQQQFSESRTLIYKVFRHSKPKLILCGKQPCHWLKQSTCSVSANRMVCLLQSTSFGLLCQNTLYPDYTPASARCMMKKLVLDFFLLHRSVAMTALLPITMARRRIHIMANCSA